MGLSYLGSSWVRFGARPRQPQPPIWFRLVSGELSLGVGKRTLWSAQLRSHLTRLSGLSKLESGLRALSASAPWASGEVLAPKSWGLGSRPPHISGPSEGYSRPRSPRRLRSLPRRARRAAQRGGVGRLWV